MGLETEKNRSTPNMKPIFPDNNARRKAIADLQRIWSHVIDVEVKRWNVQGGLILAVWIICLVVMITFIVAAVT